MPSSEPVNWQPMSQMPLVAGLIDGALRDGADVGQHVRANLREAGRRERAAADASAAPCSDATEAAPALCTQVSAHPGNLVDRLLDERFSPLGDVRVERRLGLGGCERFVLERMEFGIALGRLGDRCGCLEVTQDVRRLAVGHAGWFSAGGGRPGVSITSIKGQDH
jgi:hypothetical protein